MDQVADFLARAVEAERQAARGTGTFRTQLLGLAELWRSMAHKAEVLGELEQMLARGDLDPRAPVRADTTQPSFATALAGPRVQLPAGPRPSSTTGEPGS